MAACSSATPASVPADRVLESEAGKLAVTTVAEGLEHPWGLAFLPDGRALVTERPGRLRLLGTDGRLSAPLAGVPPVRAVGQGGLLDVALDPDFAQNGLVYLSYSEPGEGDTSGTSVARARLQGESLQDLEVIFRQRNKLDSKHHYGSRLVFARDGHLFVTLGDRGSQRDSAQDLATHFGKVVRIRPDGGVPEDNPYLGREGALPETFSLGHRNVQGADLHPVTGELWGAEFGPRGGDEVNRIQAGLNYGWPVITYGREYYGPSIGEGTEKAGMEQPVYHWVPSVSPSGIAFYTGDLIEAWKGQLLLATLSEQALIRLQVSGDNRVVREERIDLGERLRHVRQGPDGAIYLLTDSGTASRILRLAPAS
ncbi:MAG: PQQ-dependent sugar dehydrogenase [Steroidobacteraceae bacterium]